MQKSVLGPDDDPSRSPESFRQSTPFPEVPGDGTGASVASLASGEDPFTAAQRHHNAGRLDEAEALYRRVVEGAPRHVGALHALGVLAAQKGLPDQAEQWIRRELALAPAHAEALSNLGGVIAGQGRPAEALEYFERALALNPDLVDAHFNRGFALQKLGRHEEAL